MHVDQIEETIRRTERDIERLQASVAQSTVNIYDRGNVRELLSSVVLDEVNATIGRRSPVVSINAGGQYRNPGVDGLKRLRLTPKYIRLISRRVAIFPAAAARQIFDDCDAANRKKISVVIPRISDPVGSSINGQKSFP